MRFLVNENVPLTAIVALREAQLDIVSVRETLAGASDTEVLAQANREGSIIVTFDKDFAELVFREGRRSLAGVILLRLRPQSPQRVAQVLVDLLTSDRPWEGYFTVVTEAAVRMVPLT